MASINKHTYKITWWVYLAKFLCRIGLKYFVRFMFKKPGLEVYLNGKLVNKASIRTLYNKNNWQV